MSETLAGTEARAAATPETASGNDGAHRPRPTRKRRGGGISGGINWWVTALIAVCSLTVLIPLYLTVVTALKTPDQLGGTGFELPTSVRWEAPGSNCRPACGGRTSLTPTT